ncbi:hypothetical protein Pmani_024528 [Petrolisthes manimaculis]|uniref:Regulator of G-protein signaling 9 n=1 Tax=Petrolisthes manimaculis TaxID=1843537 RepID=A0AAE1PA56_9EUCA|nr:hypothetical protein Pmani_024528 [Petrolisthes manimaculis]
MGSGGGVRPRKVRPEERVMKSRRSKITWNPDPKLVAKMESLVREMQNPETGVPIRSLKVFLKSIPSAFMGYDLIEWLLERLEIEDSMPVSWTAEAIHLANLLCQYGYFFPVGDSRSLIVKDDSSLYRFQTPYYWPSQTHSDDSTDYAIYLTKRLSRNKQKHALEDYEIEAYNRLKKALAHKWDFVTMQAEEQVKLNKDRKKDDKTVTDSQERAYWRVYRPPPGFTNCLETAPVPDKTNMANRVRKKTIDDLKKDNVFLASAVVRTRQKVSQAAEGLLTYCDTYFEYDPFLNFPQPSNPWHSDDTMYWALNDTIVDIPTEKRVKRWAISMEELINDVMGQEEFTAYLRKEYCHENIRFWQAVNDLKFGKAVNVSEQVQDIYEEFLKPGAPCEINIDGKTMESTQMLMKSPTRFTFDLASEHVYILLLKKDCYPRFLRSEQYKTLLANALQPTQKKRPNSVLVRLMAPSLMLAPGPDGRGGLQMFFSFGPGKKKGSTPVAPNNISLSQTPQPLKRYGSDDQAVAVAGTAPHGSTGSMGDGGTGIHKGGTSGNKLDCEPPYSCAERQSLLPLEPSMSNAVCPWEPPAHNICPWEAVEAPAPRTQPPPVKVPDEKLTYPKVRPDRSKSVDVSSVPKRQSSVSVAPNLGPELTEERPSASICPWETQELPNRTTEKSKSIDVDVCPWDPGDSIKKTSTSSSPEIAGVESVSQETRGAGAGNIMPHSLVKKDGTRPPCERKISIQVCCPWEEVEEVELSESTSERPHARHPSEDSVGRDDDASKSKEKVSSVSCSTSEKPGSLPVSEVRPGMASEGTSSPSSTCSSSSHSETRRIKIDYTVKSGHLPGQYGLPITSSPAGSASPGAQQTTTIFSSGSGSTTSSGSAGGHHTQPESPHNPIKLPCPVDTGSKPASPKVAGSMVAPWENNPPQKVTDICPWEDEESCKVDTPFVKTYATLGYL